jgi:hypothetical protein
MARDERNQASTSDSSSIGPSQSVSQIGHQLPAVPNTSQPTEDKGDPTMPRPRSVLSTAPSSLYYTPITPATYKTETVTYAPAISLIVPASVPSSPMGSDINTPLALGPSLDIGSLGRPNTLALSPYAPDTEVHTKMHIPAAHSINEYVIPTAEVATGSESGTWRHSRGESQEGLTRFGPHPQRITSASGPNASLSNLSSSSSTMNQRRILERRITEEDLSGNNPPIVDLSHGGGRTAASTRVVGSALIEVFDNNPVNYEEEEEDDELPGEAEDQLIKQGKLAVVENPRFMREERRRELERERQREQMKLAGHESEPEPEKKKFLFLHKRAGTQSQADAEHVIFAPTTPAVPSTPKGSLRTGENIVNYSPPTKSPSKRFFGSLKGLFGARQPASPPVPLPVRDSSPSRLRGRSPTRIHTDVGLGDDSDDDSPTKAGGGLQALLRGAGAKKKVPDGKWSTRTDNNIRKLTRNGGVDDEDFDAYLSENVGKGAAGDVVVKAGLAGSVITGARGVSKRSASDIETAPVVASGSTVTDGRKKLKKTLPSSAGRAASVSSPFTQQKGTTSGVVVHEHPSTTRKDLKVIVPGKRSASVDESARRTSMVQQGVVGQTPVGGGNDVIVDLENRRRRTISDVGGPPAMNPPVGTSAQRMPAARTPVAGTSTVARGDTAAASSGQAVLSKKKSVVRNAGPAAASIPTAATTKATPAAAKAATPSKPTLTRQPSVGKTQTPTTPNIPVDNVNIKAGGPRQPQPHRQHSASSSGAIVLPAGGAHPSGTLISQPGWDAQALPTGGGLSRNSSILSGVSGPGGAGGAGAGGMSKTKKQKQTALGHGMGSGTSVGRRSSLGSSSGHGGPINTVVQPTQPAQSLMSIVEDVAKHNREWSQESSQLLKDRKKVVGGGALVKGPVGMVDVARAPPRVGRDELSQLNPAMIKARVMETSTTPAPGTVFSVGGVGVGGGGVGGGRLVDIKAPGSVFDQRKAHVGSELAMHQQVSNSTTQSQQANVIRRSSVAAGPVATSTPAARSKRPAKSPLRSALKNPSRTPSPLPGPFLVPHLQKQQEALQEGSRLSNSGVIPPVPVPPAQSSTILGSQRPTNMANGRPTSHDSVSQRRKGKRQIQGASDVGEAGDSTSTNDTGNEMFYTDDEGDDGKAAAVSSTSMLNGHAVGSSDLSHSTTSTAVVHRPPATTTSSASQLTAPSAPRRRKSVRVSLQPTFSPPPPAIDDEEEEQKYREPRAWKRDHHGGGQQQLLDVHAPVPVAAGSSLLLNPVHKIEPDIWQDSSDEDAEYQNAKRLLTRAARKEKDMNVFAAGSRRS